MYGIDTSDRSNYSPTASLSSFASGRWTIYNLQALNVMTDTIVDVGTMVAECGSGMMALTGMEPIEVWAANANMPMLSSRSSYRGSHPTMPTPTSSAILLSSASSHVPSAFSADRPKKKKNIFGKTKSEPIPIPNIPTYTLYTYSEEAFTSSERGVAVHATHDVS
ncbi:hypothetical protein BDZ89DRAFT_1146591 [Hymenopellis radicata]|nr:hypothetical protein BDZ89DRAFT_1146591 [Hymenopellis radicata]